MKKFLMFAIVIGLISSCASSPRQDIIGEEFKVDVRRARSIPIGEMELLTNGLLAGLNKLEATILYYPQEDAVCIQFRKDFINCSQFWSADGRQAFIQALETYKRDYEERSFGKSSRQTKRHYGTVKSYFAWNSHAYSVHADASLNIELGYFFAENRPYFTTNQKPAFFIHHMDKADNRQHPELTLFFTRALADELATMFNQELLDSIAPNYSTGFFEPDEY